MSPKLLHHLYQTDEQVKEHYEIEKQLAHQLRSASREDRLQLYTALYNELFQRVPYHPQLTRKANLIASDQEVARKLRLLDRYLQPDTIFLEVGAGDCQLAFAAANRVQQVYAVDVSSEITKNRSCPTNFQFIISDGCSIPVPNASISVAYSNQLMEHLHPDDALIQLQNIYQSLCPGGIYVCITPNRLSGPHDVSQYFDDVATGFHLKEYTHTELSYLLKSVGFSHLTTYIGGKGYYLPFSAAVVQGVEWLLDRTPSLRKQLGKTLPLRAILGVIVVARK